MSDPSIPLDWIPSIPRRYATTAVDALLVLVLFIVPTVVLPEGEVSRVFRIALAAAAVLLYEPLGTGHWMTLGQWLTGVRVRDMKTGRPIGVPRAWGRIIVKMLLGVVSFLLLPVTPGRRALHDMASGSIVILAKSEVDFARWASHGGLADDTAVGVRT